MTKSRVVLEAPMTYSVGLTIDGNQRVEKRLGRVVTMPGSRDGYAIEVRYTDAIGDAVWKPLPKILWPRLIFDLLLKQLEQVQ